eukprot:scaffold5500_cov248-Pinguiococcus_pyrenoidosus.AAC.5
MRAPPPFGRHRCPSEEGAASPAAPRRGTRTLGHTARPASSPVQSSSRGSRPADSPLRGCLCPRT